MQVSESSFLNHVKHTINQIKNLDNQYDYADLLTSFEEILTKLSLDKVANLRDPFFINLLNNPGTTEMVLFKGSEELKRMKQEIINNYNKIC